MYNVSKRKKIIKTKYFLLNHKSLMRTKIHCRILLYAIGIRLGIL